MFKVSSSSPGVALVIGAVLMYAGCTRNEGGGSDSGLVATETGSVMNNDPAMAAPRTDSLSDANIVYILDRANALDSASGSIAATKGTNSEIRDFARMMVRDHHALREQGQLLARKLNVTPAAPAGGSGATEMARTMSMLSSAAKGRDFDKAYIDDQVTFHVNLLETATQVMAAAQNPELKNYIQKAAPAVRLHLDSAQAIQRRMM